MTLGIVAAAKKTQKRWIQMTLTGGAPKGATDWLKPGTVIEPSTIHLATAQEFENSGWKIPDFLEEKMNNICVIIFTSDTTKRPLLIHQKTAIVQVLLWMKQITYTEDQDGPIEIIHTKHGNSSSTEMRKRSSTHTRWSPMIFRRAEPNRFRPSTLGRHPVRGGGPFFCHEIWFRSIVPGDLIYQDGKTPKLIA